MAKSPANMKGICLLCMLEKRPMHGYEIMKQFEARFKKSVGASAVYPLLKDYEEKGYLKIDIEFSGKKEKKVYSLTKKGRELCLQEKGKVREILKEMFEEDD